MNETDFNHRGSEQKSERRFCECPNQMCTSPVLINKIESSLEAITVAMPEKQIRSSVASRYRPAAKIEDRILSNDINMGWILKRRGVRECRGLGIKSSHGLKATINLTHQKDKRINQITITPKHPGNVLNDIKSREVVNTAVRKWQRINAKSTTKVIRLTALNHIHADANIGIGGIATALATAKIYRCLCHEIVAGSAAELMITAAAGSSSVACSASSIEQVVTRRLLGSPKSQAETISLYLA
jgi:hypothetical protein